MITLLVGFPLIPLSRGMKKMRMVGLNKVGSQLKMRIASGFVQFALKPLRIVSVFHVDTAWLVLDVQQGKILPLPFLKCLHTICAL